MLGQKISKDHKKFLEMVQKRYPNVVGYSLKYQKKVVRGKETETPCLRVYVSKKIEKINLRKEEIIPSEAAGDVPTDVIEVGDVKALNFRDLLKATNVSKTEKNRPVPMCVSIGNYAITAGTCSYLMRGKDGEIYVSSNAHVFTDGNPSLPPNEIVSKVIVQPGKYDGGTLLDGVASYVWHKQIYPIGSPSECPVGKTVCGIYNLFSSLFGRKTRLEAVVEDVYNIIDFAVAKPYDDVSFSNKLFDEGNLENIKSVGLLFAGSETSTIVCKMSNIVAEGYTPIEPYNNVADVSEGMEIWKSGRTTCKTSGKVLDSSGVVTVSYGNFSALFADVIISDMKSAGGDSGSPVWCYGA